MSGGHYCYAFRGVQDVAECLIEDNRLDYNCCTEENAKREFRKNPKLNQLSNCNCAKWVEQWNGEKWIRIDNEFASLRREFAEHLLLIAKAMKAIEWVDSDDMSPGDEIDYIKACLKK